MDPSPSSPATPLKLAQLNILQAINKLQNQCSSFLHHLHRQHFSTTTPFLNPNPDSTNFHLEFTDAKKPPRSISYAKSPLWARIAADNTYVGGGAAMSDDDIEKRLDGVCVYTVSKSESSDEFLLVSDKNQVKSLALMCFKEENAEAILGQMKSMDPRMLRSYKVAPVALSEVLFQLIADEFSFRLIPEALQTKYAIERRRRDGVKDGSFSGVPVFQSRNLTLWSENKRYCPAFFRKEDLHKYLAEASNEPRFLYPCLRVGDYEVAALEDIIHGMKDDSTTAWNDVVFIPPGFHISTNQSRQ